MRRFLFLPIAVTLLSQCCSRDYYASLNAQAEKEYLTAVRPGTEGKNPFWNGFANKFIYAPAFDFPEVEGAVKYRFTVEDYGPDRVRASRYYPTLTDDPDPCWVEGPGAPTGKVWTFDADTPKADLSPVWNSIQPAVVHLKVEGLGKDGGILGVSGERTFLRDFPFHGPYHSNVRPYGTSALMAAVFVHEDPAIHSWLTSTEPDMSYRHNTYACKIIGHTIRLECALAKMSPELSGEALTMARNAAEFLLTHCQGEDAPLAYFPPTYYLGLISSSREENQGKTMTMEATFVGNAFLDLYDATSERKYMDRAAAIADTYVKLQAEDGSYPIKVDYETGEPVNSCRAMLSHLIMFFNRFADQYGIHTYSDASARALKWMKETAMSSFDMTGQFEDMTVLNQKPYQNLTECASCPFARVLLAQKSITEEDMRDACDLIRFSEDQFVYWNELPNSSGFGCLNPPSVVEQYGYRVPIDNSTCEIANALLDWWEVTGDPLAFEKAKALVDNLTIVQNAVDGHIPTCLDVRSGAKSRARGWWVNCTYSSIMTLLRMEEITNRQK